MGKFAGYSAENNCDIFFRQFPENTKILIWLFPYNQYANDNCACATSRSAIIFVEKPNIPWYSQHYTYGHKLKHYMPKNSKR